MDTSQIQVTVRYIDGTQVSGPPHAWPYWRGDGVDWVEVRNPSGACRFASQSLYWLYKECDYIVAGCGSVRYDPNPLTEIIFHENSQAERTIPFLPDLHLQQVKLGWWWPNSPRPEFK